MLLTICIQPIKDWDLESKGVIPDPLVDELSIADIVAAERTDKSSCVNDGDETGDAEGTCVADPATGNTTGDDGIRVVAISATDGVLDYISPHDIAQEIANSLFGGSGEEKRKGGDDKHLLAAIAELLATSAKGWHRDMRGSYRDDMAISATVVK